jgi:hypothetical protein
VPYATGRTIAPIEIIRSTPRDISIVGINMRAEDRAEFEAGAAYRSASDAALFCHHTSGRWSAVVLLRGEPVAAFGCAGSPLQPQVRAAWAFGTRRFRRVVPWITREVEAWKPHLIAAGVHRVEARALVGHDIAGIWLLGLGCVKEGTMRRMGRGGEDFDLYAWVADDVLSSRDH